MTNLTQHSLFARLTHQPVVRELHVSEEVHALMVFHQMDFVRVQFKPQLFLQKLLYRSKELFKLLFVAGYEYKIVGVADIVLGFKFVLNKLVKLIHIHIRKELRGQVADRYAARMKEIGIAACKATDNFSHQPHDLGIFNAPRQYLQQYFVVDAVKKLPHVALERVAGARTVAADRAEHVCQPLYAFVTAFADAARKGIRYEPWLKNRVKHFEYSVVEHPVAHYCFVYVPQLRVGDIKAGIRAVFVSFVSKVMVQLKNMLLQVLLKLHDIILAPLVLLELIPCVEQMLDRGHVFKYSLVGFNNYD